MKKVDCYKLNGLGNSYVFFDLTKEDLEEQYLEQLQKSTPDISNSFSSDGVIVLLSPKTPGVNLQMRIFNDDASEAEMCGNGSRAFAKLAKDLCLVGYKAIFENKDGKLFETEILREYNDKKTNKECAEVKVKMFYPPKVTERAELVNGFAGYRAEIGNPHFVVEKPDLDADFDLALHAQPIEMNTDVFPEKTNVEFYKVVSSSELDMRVWERGSGITQACGTGACATAAVYRQNNNNEINDIIVNMPGGPLRLFWQGENFFMQGEAMLDCRTGFDLDTMTRANK